MCQPTDMSAGLEIPQNTAGTLGMGSKEGATQMTPRNMKMFIVLPEEVTLHCPKQKEGGCCMVNGMERALRRCINVYLLFASKTRTDSSSEDKL